MNKEIEILKREVDGWIKEINSKIIDSEEIKKALTEQEGNIEYNYEIIQNLRAEMRTFKEDLSALRLVQLLHLKSEIKRNDR